MLCHILIKKKKQQQKSHIMRKAQIRKLRFTKVLYLQNYRSDQIRSVAQLCLTLCDPMNCSTPGLPDPGILQARTLEWVAISWTSFNLNIPPEVHFPNITLSTSTLEFWGGGHNSVHKNFPSCWYIFLLMYIS